MKRNRYTDVLPFDGSRVQLEGLDCDYINASVLTSRWGLGVVFRAERFPSAMQQLGPSHAQHKVRVALAQQICWCKAHITAAQSFTPRPGQQDFSNGC